MTIPKNDEIRDFLARQIEYWNGGHREQMTALYRQYALDELVIEYVGHPVGDGWAAYEHMWDTYAGQVRTEVVQVLVNGNEAACHYRNVRVASGTANPSIETYRFDEGRLHIRYFHRAAA